MRSWVLTIIVLTGLQAASLLAQAESRWVCQDFVQTNKPAEADFKIDFACTRLSKPFYQRTFYFKRDWQYLAEGVRAVRGSWGSTTMGCGPTGSLSALLSLEAEDKGVKINFSAKQTSSLASVVPVEVKKRLEIPWKELPYSCEDGDFAYRVGFSWNKGD